MDLVDGVSCFCSLGFDLLATMLMPKSTDVPVDLQVSVGLASCEFALVAFCLFVICFGFYFGLVGA